jgi:Raf kinase inhibitor-like YbhB/YbcL family protein
MHKAKALILALALLGFVMTVGKARGGEAMAFEIKSSAFSRGQAIPKKHTCDGPDLSVPLSWTDAPAGTKSFAFIADDPDAPMGTWVHWVVYDLPAEASQLPEGVPKQETLRDGSKQGMNDFRRIGYGGPCPPPGPAHRYFFKLYALDKKIGLPPGETKQQVLDAIQGHTLGQAQLMGTYKR